MVLEAWARQMGWKLVVGGGGRYRISSRRSLNRSFTAFEHNFRSSKVASALTQPC
jgi:hypothetical protein